MAKKRKKASKASKAKQRKKAKKRKKSKPTARVGRLGIQMVEVVQKLIDGSGIGSRWARAMKILKARLKAAAEKHFMDPNIHKVFYGVSLDDPRNPIRLAIPVAEHVTRATVQGQYPDARFLCATRAHVGPYAVPGKERVTIRCPSGQMSKAAALLADQVTKHLSV